jgi:ABC-2 type transport system permease protein
MRPLVIAWKELIQLRRDRLTLGMVLALPLMQLLLFGYAINTDVRHIPLVVYDQDGSAASRDLARTLEVTGSYRVLGPVSGYDEIGRLLRQGRARAALVIPPRFGSDVKRGRPTAVQLVVDGSDPQTVASATQSATGLAAARSQELLVGQLRALGRGLAAPPITVQPATWYNPELRTAVFVVPGLVGIILTMTMVMLTAMAIARERERGTLEQLIVSPVGRVELVAGKILPYIAIGYVQMALIFVFIAANLALGLFFSTLARTQQQAMQMSFFFFLPNILLSGFMFPFEAMPRPAQLLSECLPLTHFLRIVRGVTLKGASLGDLGGELAALAAILAVLVTLASLRFRKKID